MLLKRAYLCVIFLHFDDIISLSLVKLSFMFIIIVLPWWATVFKNYLDKNAKSITLRLILFDATIDF